MQDDPTLTEFIRDVAPRARESLSSLETLVRVNPELLLPVLEFAVVLGVRAAVVALAREDTEAKIKEMLKGQYGTFLRSSW